MMIAATVFSLKFRLAVSLELRVSQETGEYELDVSRDTGLCSCSPLKYRWILNFTNPCPPANVSVGPNTGINDLCCDIDVNSTSNSTLDSIPVMVSSFILFELNSGSVVRDDNTSLIDGDVIEFTSATNDEPDFISQGYFAEIIGRNAADERVDLSVLVDFTNICGQPPFQVGDSIGWITYVS